MKELMLELLAWEPFGKFLLKEKEYIREILSGNDNPPPSLAKFHELFSGFYDYYVQCEKFEDAKKAKDAKKFEDAKKAKDAELSRYISKLRAWKAKNGRAQLPIFYKKICFYLMVKEGFSESGFMAQIGSHVSRIREWKISPEFRKRAEDDTYSVIRSYRSGTKRKYLVSLIKRLYYEAGRQVSQSMVLNKLPPFVDVFAGTASVAASVVTNGCPPPIVNDYDPILVCFAWAFTYYQSKLCAEIAEFHNDLMKKDPQSANWSYDEKAYEAHYESVDQRTVLTLPKVWDDPMTQWLHMEFYGYSKEDIEEGRRLAQRHQELVIQARNSYIDVRNVLDRLEGSDDAKNCLRSIDFNKLPKNMSDPQKAPVLMDVLDYALAMFFYYSFPPLAGHIYHEVIVDVDSYSSFLNSLDASKRKNKTDKADKAVKADQAVKADTLLRRQLKASSLTLESTGSFSRHLKDAEFYCKDFRDILQNNSEAERVYYLDSPYFLTVGYDVGFSDDDHKDMLDLLRKAEFKWIFSMQYYPSKTDASTTSQDENNRKKQPHIIRDYGAYYRGFYTPFQLDTDQRSYVATDTPMEDEKNLYAILFDVKTAKAKSQEIYRNTSEMLVVNFNCLPTIPLHNSAVVLPFDLFLQCADAGMNYRDIVLKAIDWRRDYIEKNFAGKIPV